MLWAMTAPIHLHSRTVLSVAGNDAPDFLQALITQNIANAKDGALAALLSPQGKILFDFFIFKRGDEFLIDVWHDAAPALEKRLKMYKLRAKVDIVRRDDLKVIADLTGQPAGQSTGQDAVACFPDPRSSALGMRSIVDTDALSDDGREAAYHTARIGAGVPEFGPDFGPEEVFLLDVNYDALHGVDYQKGCFIGQEVTSRMKRKAQARKRSCILSAPGVTLEKGADIVAGASTLGTIMSSVPGSALGLVRIDRLEKADGDVMVGEHRVTTKLPLYLS